MENDLFQKHRMILAYHGCDQSVADEVSKNGGELEKSENSYDWLGSGIYFWEHGPKRAMEWAEQNTENPAVVGAVINLGSCFDLFDRAAIKSLESAYSGFRNLFDGVIEYPSNKPGYKGDQDNLRRELDCSVLNYTLGFHERNGISYDSVRGLFPEGVAVLEGSSIMSKTHIQISVRNRSCIIGYFRPK